jgi:hypothetical protein
VRRPAVRWATAHDVWRHPRCRKIHRRQSFRPRQSFRRPVGIKRTSSGRPIPDRPFVVPPSGGIFRQVPDNSLTRIAHGPTLARSASEERQTIFPRSRFGLVWNTVSSNTSDRTQFGLTGSRQKEAGLLTIGDYPGAKADSGLPAITRTPRTCLERIKRAAAFEKRGPHVSPPRTLCAYVVVSKGEETVAKSISRSGMKGHADFRNHAGLQITASTPP